MFASAGQSLHIYSLESGSLKTVSKYSPKSGINVKQISWCHDNSYIALLPEDGLPQIVSAKDPSQVGLIHTITSIPKVTALQFKSNTKRILALGTQNGDVILYDTKNRCVTKTLGRLSSEIRALQFNSLNELAVISDDNLIIYNLIDSEVVELINPQICTAMKCLNNGHIVVGCQDGTMIVWDHATRSEVNVYQMHTSEITGINLSTKDKLIISAGADSKICFIDQITQECIFKKILHHPVTSLDISACEQYMVAGLRDGSICVYHLNDHLKPQISSRMHFNFINQISFVKGLTMIDSLESSSFLDGDTCIEVKNITAKDIKENIVPSEQKSTTEMEDLTKELQVDTPRMDDIEIPEEKVKLELMKLINGHFSHLEEQLTTHCDRLQTLVCSELDSLYAVAARWECFKTMELEEIVRYICGIVSATSETKTMSRKS